MGEYSGLVSVLDGATIQLAGELLLSHPGTESERRLGKSSYISCLEDFAFAIIFTDGFVSAGKMPTVGAGRPGETLAHRFSWLRRSPIRTAFVGPEALISNRYVRKSIFDDLRSLAAAFELGRERWFHWIDREAAAYLGNDVTLTRHESEGSVYVFGKDPEYFVDAELEDAIPVGTLDILVSRLEGVEKHKHATRSAKTEFVRRALLATVVVDKWYDLQTSQASEHIRIPFPIRSAIKLAKGEPSIESTRRQLRGVFVRSALQDLCRSDNYRDRIELMDALASIREAPEYTRLRQSFRDLDVELGAGSTRNADLILQDLRRGESGKEQLDSFSIEQERIGIDHSVVVRLLRSAGRPSLLEDSPGFRRLFPELWEESRPSIAPENRGTQDYASVLISYGRGDEVLARAVHSGLVKAGVKTWFFEADAQMGDLIHHEVFRAVQSCDRMLVLCSRTSLIRAGVLYELELARAREAVEGGKPIILPVALDEVVDEEWWRMEPGADGTPRPANLDAAELGRREALGSAMRSRVVGDMKGAQPGDPKWQEGIRRLLEALRRRL